MSRKKLDEQVLKADNFILTEQDEDASGYVMIDKTGTAGTTWIEDEYREEEVPFDELFHLFTKTHLFVIAVLYLSCGILFHMLIDWSDVIGLWINLGLFFLQLVWAVDKIPGLRIRTQDYLKSSIPLISATLEETTRGTSRTDWERCCCCLAPRSKSSYVVLYSAPSAYYARTVGVRKTLQSGYWDADLATSHEDGFAAMTKLLCKDDDPFSAYPRYAIEEHHSRYKTWVRYYLPLLILTTCVVLYNIWYTKTTAWGTHVDYLPPALCTFAALATLILPNLIYVSRKFVTDVNGGGKEISPDGAVVVVEAMA
jgi:hypothetical protein